MNQATYFLVRKHIAKLQRHCGKLSTTKVPTDRKNAGVLCTISVVDLSVSVVSVSKFGWLNSHFGWWKKANFHAGWFGTPWGTSYNTIICTYFCGISPELQMLSGSLQLSQRTPASLLLWPPQYGSKSSQFMDIYGYLWLVEQIASYQVTYFHIFSPRLLLRFSNWSPGNLSPWPRGVSPRRRGGRCVHSFRGLPALALPALAAAGLHRPGGEWTDRSGPGGDGGAMGCHGMPWMVPPNWEVRGIFTLGYGRKNTTWSWRIPYRNIEVSVGLDPVKIWSICINGGFSIATFDYWRVMKPRKTTGGASPCVCWCERFDLLTFNIRTYTWDLAKNGALGRYPWWLGELHHQWTILWDLKAARMGFPEFSTRKSMEMN